MINNNQKGVSVYLTIVIMVVLLAVVLGLASIIVGGAKIAGTLGDSVKAFHAADSGIEYSLYCVKFNNGDCKASWECANSYESSSSENAFSTSYGWKVNMYDSAGVACESSSSIAVSKVESEGTYSKTKRKIEVSF